MYRVGVSPTACNAGADLILGLETIACSSLWRPPGNRHGVLILGSRYGSVDVDGTFEDFAELMIMFGSRGGDPGSNGAEQEKSVQESQAYYVFFVVFVGRGIDFNTNNRYIVMFGVVFPFGFALVPRSGARAETFCGVIRKLVLTLSILIWICFIA